LKKEVEEGPKDKKYDVDLTYITSRGKWYFNSWKGDEKKSGGVSTNIGVHFYDMLHFVFGKVLQNTLHYRDEYKAGGFIEYEKARVRWFLSVDFEDIPIEMRLKGTRTHRSLTMNGREIEFSDGFTDLHTRIYENILNGGGFSLEDNRVAIETVGDIRNQLPHFLEGDYHPFLKKKI
jgi:UDP-N-acetyl-2-amino-2-deoxyglucuronate dehydrogenase